VKSSELDQFSSATMGKVHDLANLISERQQFVLTTHYDADGDGLGAEAALTAGLRQLGKSVAVLNNEATPRRYRFLDGDHLFRRYDPAKHRHLVARSDVLILLDASRRDRMHRLETALAGFGGRTAILDHHRGGGWGDVEVIESEACSTTELVCTLLDSLGLDLTPQIAEALLVGVLVDTGSLTNPNATSRACRIAARLIDAGAEVERLREALFASWPLERLRLEAQFLAGLRTRHHGRLIWGVVDHQALTRWRQGPSATEGLAERALAVRHTQLSVLFLEEAEQVRVRLRSRGRVRVDDLARSLGGNGHAGAAGAKVPGPLRAAIHRVLGEASTLLR